jgi:hypothetical protein
MKKYLLLIILCVNYLTAQMQLDAKTKLQSLVLPGWGEQTLGESKRAQSFFIREAALWLIYIGGKKTANWYESDYKAFAELHADVDMGDKNYLFAVNLGHYDSFEEFNDTKERKRQVENKYEKDKGLEWQWDNSFNRFKYDEMRIKSVTYDKYERFAVGSLILHRLVSFIDVIYLERTNLQVNIEPQLEQDFSSMKLNLSLKF